MDQAKTLGGVSRGLQLQPHPVREHGVGRSAGQHRLPGGRDHAAPPELVRAGAGARRRPLRVGRLSADQRAAARRESRRRGIIATANNYLFPPDFPYPEALHYTGADPYRVSRISEVLGSGRLAHRRRHDAAAERQRLAARARAWCRCCATCRSRDAAVAKARDAAAGVERQRGRRLGAGGHLRDVAASAVRPTSASCSCPKEAQPFVGQPNLKRVIDWLNAPDGRFGADPRRARRAARPQPERGGRRADQAARPRHERLAVGPGAAITTR